MKSDIAGLLRVPGFIAFFTTQFLGAFNDNLFKTALSLLIAFKLAASSEGESSVLVNLAAILFILPFFLFSPRAGLWADRYDKVVLIQRIKLTEILVMLLGALGFFFSSTYFLLAVLFLMGAQSTFFGPLKYSYLPQVLRAEQLVSANALIQGSTFIGIILGMMLAGLLFGVAGEHLTPVWLATLALAALGYAASRGMPRGSGQAQPAGSRRHEGVVALIRLARRQPTVWQAILGISWFWMVGATYITQLPNFVRYYAYANEQVFLLCLSLFAIGIGLGALLCSGLRKRAVGRYSAMIGLSGLILAGLLVSGYRLEPVSELRTLAGFGIGQDLWLSLGLLLLGVSGGLYIVPLYTVLQTQSDDRHRSRMVAVNNILNALYMVVSAAIILGLFAGGLTISQLFFGLALSNLLMIGYWLRVNPDFLRNIGKLYQPLSTNPTN